jgi:hypothetical protein
MILLWCLPDCRYDEAPLRERVRAPLQCVSTSSSSLSAKSLR